MRVFRRLFILILAPTVALAFVVPRQGLPLTRKAPRILAASDSNVEASSSSAPTPKVVKTRRELRVEQLQQEIERQLQEREELRLQLEQDIAAFERQYEAERSQLDSVDVTLTKQIQRLNQVQNGGAGFQQVLDSFDGSFNAIAPLVALSGAAVVGRNVLVQQRERRLEQERERERLQQQEELKRLLEEETQNKLIQTRRTAIAVRDYGVCVWHVSTFMCFSLTIYCF